LNFWRIGLWAINLSFRRRRNPIRVGSRAVEWEVAVRLDAIPPASE
jgi:hypothetical protein